MITTKARYHVQISLAPCAALQEKPNAAIRKAVRAIRKLVPRRGIRFLTLMTPRGGCQWKHYTVFGIPVRVIQAWALNGVSEHALQSRVDAIYEAK